MAKTTTRVKSIGASSLWLASGTMVSRILGFVRVIVLAQTIGVVGSASADAYANAMALPSAIYAVVAGGMLNAVLVPQVVRAAKDEDGGQKYINRLVTLGLIILAVLATLATLAAPILARIYGASLDLESLGLVIGFAYWCLPQIFFYGLYALLGEVLNARGSFGPFTWAQVFNNALSIAMLFVFAAIYGADPSGSRPISAWTPDMIAFLGCTTTIAVAFQAIILMFFWRRIGLTYKPDFHFKGVGLGRAGAMASWTFGMLLIVQLTGVVEAVVANLAFGASASLSALQNAFLMFVLPHSIVAVSIATAYFTRMSEAAADNDHARLVKDFSESSRLIGLLLVFSAGGLMVISPSFSRIFESDFGGAMLLAAMLCMNLLGLPAFSMLFLMQRMFYALEDGKRLFFAFLATAPIHIFALAISATLPVELIAVGICVAQTLIYYVRVSVLTLMLRKRLGPIDLKRQITAHLQQIVAVIIAMVPTLAVMWMLGVDRPEGFAMSSISGAIISCAIGGIVVAICYFVCLRLLKSRELDTLIRPVLSRLGGIGERLRPWVLAYPHATAESVAADDVDAALIAPASAGGER